MGYNSNACAQLFTGSSLLSMPCPVTLKAAESPSHKAYIRGRENDFSLSGLLGVNLFHKTAGIVGTGRIGAAMARICHGFGMKVLATDVYHNPSLDLQSM